jgi:Flp pilus assembly protein TadG
MLLVEAGINRLLRGTLMPVYPMPQVDVITVCRAHRIHRRGTRSHRRLNSLLRENRSGAAAVELAVLLPLIVFIFCVSLDFCRVFYFSVTVTNCARNGAIYGSADTTQARDEAGIQAAALADAVSNLDTQLLTISSSTDASASYVQVTVEYPFTAIISYPGIPKSTNLSRTVRMDVVPAIPTYY